MLWRRGRVSWKSNKRDTGSLGRGEHTEPSAKEAVRTVRVTSQESHPHHDTGKLPAPVVPQGAGLLLSGPPGKDPTCSFCLNTRHSGINLCVSPSSLQCSLINIPQTSLALLLSNSVRRHFNESEPGQFRTEAGISIHSQGAFSRDLSQEAKLFRSPSGIVSKFLGA